MKYAVSIPITAKTRIGIDTQDSFTFFSSFAHHLVDAGCDKLIVHARKAWLKGLNPKQNRTIPPLHYDYAYRLKEELPSIPIVINGNIETIADITSHMQGVNGVMIGRLACKNPYAIAAIHDYFYPNTPIKKRSNIIREYLDYCVLQFEQGVPLSLLIKPILNFSYGLSGTKSWKEQLILAQQNKKIAPLEIAYAILQEIERQCELIEVI